MKRALERTCRQLIRRHGASRDRINDACRRVAAAINDWEAKKTPSEDASPESAKAAPIERNLGQRRYRRRSSRPFVATL